MSQQEFAVEGVIKVMDKIKLAEGTSGVCGHIGPVILVREAILGNTQYAVPKYD